MSSQWLNFDEHQIAALYHSVLVAQARNGFYILPENQTAAKPPFKTPRNVSRFRSRYDDRRRWRRSDAWDTDPELDEEDAYLYSIFASKRVEIGLKIAIVVVALLISLAKNS